MNTIATIQTSISHLTAAQRTQVMDWFRELRLREDLWEVAEPLAEYSGKSQSGTIARPRLYLESSIIGYLAASPTRDLIRASRQSTTREWWELRRAHFEICISEHVVKEAGGGNPASAKLRLDVLSSLNLLEVTEPARALAALLLRDGHLPQKAATDAAHIAIAAVTRMDYLLTWNCRHIANAEIIPKVKKVFESEGYVFPVICTPEALMGGHAWSHASPHEWESEA